MSLKKLTTMRFLMLVLALAMVAIMPLSMASASDLAPDAEDQVAQSGAPGVSCPVGYTMLATYEMAPPALDNALIWSDFNVYQRSEEYTLNLASDTHIKIVGWTAVGHPEAGCVVGGDASNYNGIYGTQNVCDTSNPTYLDQANEHFDIKIDGNFVGYVADPGDHQWGPIPEFDAGLVAAGSHVIRFEMPNNNTAPATHPDPSVGYQIGICGEVPPPPPSDSCTYTQGWYRNHDWPSADVNRGTAFYSSGLNWYDALTAQPRGDAYYILSQQYVAAYLNVASGAPAPDALAQATAWFQTYGPGQRNNTDAGRAANNLAGLLDAFNNGFTGPGHCD